MSHLLQKVLYDPQKNSSVDLDARSATKVGLDNCRYIVITLRVVIFANVSTSAVFKAACQPHAKFLLGEQIGLSVAYDESAMCGVTWS